MRWIHFLCWVSFLDVLNGRKILACQHEVKAGEPSQNDTGYTHKDEGENVFDVVPLPSKPLLKT